jgi:RNA-directed DNA polymerase
VEIQTRKEKKDHCSKDDREASAVANRNRAWSLPEDHRLFYWQETRGASAGDTCHLPQGAPTSPAITNLLCYKMDKRLAGLAAKNECAYTRYADDITFSTNREQPNASSLVWRIRKILSEEGFTLHPDKVRIMHKGSRQEVTGIVVNERPAIDRKTLHQFRAALHRLEKEGSSRVEWGNGNLASSLTGYANFVKMVDPVKGAVLKAKLALLLQEKR